MENPIEQSGPILEHPKIKDFIKRFKIPAEDMETIEKLAAFDINLIIECLHNHFNLNHERSVRMLELEIQSVEDRKKGVSPDMLSALNRKQELYETILPFARKYEWRVCFSLIRVLENLGSAW